MKRPSKLIKTLAAMFSATAIALAAVSSSFAQNYDLVILGSRVMDPETMFYDTANLGIDDGRILAITESVISGRKTIDAKKRVVAPGFIGTHFHWTCPIGYKLALRDGVTTAVDLEAGVYNGRNKE